MDSRKAIASTLNTSMMVLQKYIEDFSDDELLQSPGEGCNSVAWQLGHLVSSQVSLLQSVAPGAGPELPAGFAQRHSKEGASNPSKDGYHSAAKYLELFHAANTSVVNSLSKLTDEELDAPSPEHLRSFFPTVGDIYILMAVHPLMHAGQFVPLRRKLSKPVVI